MGAITIGVLDIGAMLVGGLVGRLLPKIVSGAECPPDCVCSATEKDQIRAKIGNLRAVLDQLEAAL